MKPHFPLGANSLPMIVKKKEEELIRNGSIEILSEWNAFRLKHDTGLIVNLDRG